MIIYEFVCVSSGSRLQDWATDPDKTSDDKEEEERNEETKIEKDDVEKLSKMRNWDDWKDGEFHVFPCFQFSCHCSWSSISDWADRPCSMLVCIVQVDYLSAIEVECGTRPCLKWKL